jgi:hypothetical protein
MLNKPTDKQIKFAQNIFSGMNQAEAYRLAGYSAKSTAVANVNACRLLKTDNVLLKIKELRERVDSNKIMSVRERKERLSEIARGNLTDYQTSGLDGSGYINIGKESPNTAAIAGIKSSTKFDENGNTGTLFTEIKLHNPVMAIAELNKMGGDYAPIKTDVTNKGAINVNMVVSAKELTDDQLASIAARSGSRIIEQKTSKESPTALLSVHNADLRDTPSSVSSS